MAMIWPLPSTERELSVGCAVTPSKLSLMVSVVLLSVLLARLCVDIGMSEYTAETPLSLGSKSSSQALRSMRTTLPELGVCAWLMREAKSAVVHVPPLAACKAPPAIALSESKKFCWFCVRCSSSDKKMLLTPETLVLLLSNATNTETVSSELLGAMSATCAATVALDMSFSPEFPPPPPPQPLIDAASRTAAMRRKFRDVVVIEVSSMNLYLYAFFTVIRTNVCNLNKALHVK